MKVPCFPIAVMMILTFFLTSCLARPPGIQQAADFERRVQANMDRNARSLLGAQRETYRAEAHAHAATKHKWAIERVRTQAKADDSITVDDVIDEMEERRRVLEANRLKADAQVERMRRLEGVIEEDRLTRERIRAGLDEFERHRPKVDEMIKIIRPPERE